MDVEGEVDADDANAFQPGLFDADDYDVFDPMDGSSEDEDWTREDEDDSCRVGAARVPPALLQLVAAQLSGDVGGNLASAWMLAVAEQFPDTSLRELRSQDPSLLPPWILQGFAIYQVLDFFA